MRKKKTRQPQIHWSLIWSNADVLDKMEWCHISEGQRWCHKAMWYTSGSVKMAQLRHVFREQSLSSVFLNRVQHEAVAAAGSEPHCAHRRYS